jgi:hypothetical protein
VIAVISRIRKSALVAVRNGSINARALEDIATGIDKFGLAKVKHKTLPEHSFRTYHPTYLARSGTCERIMRKLVGIISG